MSTVTDIALDFDDASRRGDVIGAIKRAQQARARGHRGSKLGGAPPAARAIRQEQIGAFAAGLLDIAEHGEHADVIAAMRNLIPAMDADVAARARARLRATPPRGNVVQLRRSLDWMRDEPPPSSGRRPLLAADQTYQRLVLAAKERLAELGGDLAPGIRRLGGPALPDQARVVPRLIADLQAATVWPSQGRVPTVAILCAQAARDFAIAVEHDGLKAKAWAAAEACKALAVYADEWAVGQQV